MIQIRRLPWYRMKGSCDVPDGQRSQIDQPTPENSPDLHAEQVRPSTVGAYNDSAEVLQGTAAGSSPEEKRPGGHSTHAEASAVGSVPGSHGWHTVPSGEYEPNTGENRRI